MSIIGWSATSDVVVLDQDGILKYFRDLDM